MPSTLESKLSLDRIHALVGVDVDDITCTICRNILWKPIACQLCETPFCTICITKWLNQSQHVCPMRCSKFIQRSCPKFVLNKLSKLQMVCCYHLSGCKETVSYEALEKHQLACGFQPLPCSGCLSLFAKKDLSNHETTCPLIEFTCEDCKISYKRCDASTCHTDVICLKKQLQKLRNESELERRRLNEQLQTNMQQTEQLHELLNNQIRSLVMSGITSNNNPVTTERVIIQSTAESRTLDPARIVATVFPNFFSMDVVLCPKCQTVFWKPIACRNCGKVLCEKCCPRKTFMSSMMRFFGNQYPQSCNSTGCPKFAKTSAPSSVTTCLEQLQIRCAYAPNGCLSICFYNDLEEHEKQCEFEKIPCQLCRLSVSHRLNAKKHALQECFQYLYNANPCQIQQQFLTLLKFTQDSRAEISKLQANLDAAKTRIDQLDSTCVRKPNTSNN